MNFKLGQTVRVTNERSAFHHDVGEVVHLKMVGQSVVVEVVFPDFPLAVGFGTDDIEPIDETEQQTA